MLATTILASLLASATPAVVADATIVETAIAAGDFKTLVAAVQAADLVETLNGKGPFTVFAPTDAAFAKLPPETLAMLLKPENKAKLAAILTYHVVPGSVKAADVVKLKTAGSVQGQRVDIKVDGANVTVDGAKVVKTDIGCSNGVIHVIDTVILPVDGTIVDVAAKNGSFNTLVAAVKAAGLVETLSGKGPFTVLAPGGQDEGSPHRPRKPNRGFSGRRQGHARERNGCCDRRRGFERRDPRDRHRAPPVAREEGADDRFRGVNPVKA